MNEQTINLREHFGHLASEEALQLWKIWTIDVLKSYMESDTDIITLNLRKNADGSFYAEVFCTDRDEQPTKPIMIWDAEQV